MRLLQTRSELQSQTIKSGDRWIRKGVLLTKGNAWAADVAARSRHMEHLRIAPPTAGPCIFNVHLKCIASISHFLYSSSDAVRAFCRKAATWKSFDWFHFFLKRTHQLRRGKIIHQSRSIRRTAVMGGDFISASATYFFRVESSFFHPAK
jgi:hypothetical protein